MKTVSGSTKVQFLSHRLKVARTPEIKIHEKTVTANEHITSLDSA